jgi:ATPase subunit of ABC transporter with duplicated ATPase domains
VSLLNRTGVLVGRNGAGKSAILEGFEAISSYAVGRFSWSRQLDVDSIPKILEIDISTPTERQLWYIYELVVLSTSTDELDSTIDDSGTESSDVSDGWQVKVRGQ